MVEKFKAKCTSEISGKFSWNCGADSIQVCHQNAIQKCAISAEISVQGSDITRPLAWSPISTPA